MHKNFRDLPVARIEMDEQWQYVGEHGQRMNDEKKKANPNKGDFWLWAAIDADTKLVFSFIVGRRIWQVGEDFVADVSQRVVGGCQIATDNHRAYAGMIRAYFGYEAKAAVAMSLGIYNLVRKHKGIDGLTPAQAAGVEENRWTLLDVVEMTDAYWQPDLRGSRREIWRLIASSFQMQP